MRFVFTIFYTGSYQFQPEKKSTPPKVPIDLSPSYINVLKNGSASPITQEKEGGVGVQTMLFPKFSNRKSTDFKDTLSWNISHVVMKIVPISKKIVISFAMERGIPF